MPHFINMSGKTWKILEEIHPLDIIREVQKWPALYAKDSPEKGLTYLKLKIWNEIATQLFPGWDLYSESDKKNKVSDLMRKWRNLRDSWKRHVEVEKKIREGIKIKKKTYVYYSHMSFLLPHLDDSEPEESPAPREPEISIKRKLKRKERPEPKRISLNQPALPTGTVYLEGIDEDKHFLMSLIPSFKRMGDDEKLTVKMEILKAIKGVKKSSSSSTVTEARLVDSLVHSTEIEIEKGRDEIKKEIYTELEYIESDS